MLPASANQLFRFCRHSSQNSKFPRAPKREPGTRWRKKRPSPAERRGAARSTDAKIAAHDESNPAKECRMPGCLQRRRRFPAAIPPERPKYARLLRDAAANVQPGERSFSDPARRSANQGGVRESLGEPAAEEGAKLFASHTSREFAGEFLRRTPAAPAWQRPNRCTSRMIRSADRSRSTRNRRVRLRRCGPQVNKGIRPSQRSSQWRG